jgi:uncharacterized protein (DUF1330 family)
MPKGYLIAQVSVTDPEAYARYAKAAGNLLTAYGAKSIVKPDIREGKGSSYWRSRGRLYPDRRH